MAEHKEKPQREKTPPNQVVINTYESERGGKKVFRPVHVSPQIIYDKKGKPTPTPEEPQKGSNVDEEA